MEGADKSFPRIPVSTYRLQFNHTFGFNDVRGIVSYLHELGISDVYASPYFKAREGSLHGYDIVDPSALNPEVGTEEEYDAFIQELGKYRMGQVLDIVPNHMSCESENPWWMDVLENGRSSPYADFFDIDWVPAVKKLSGKLHIPVLGDQYGRILESQGLTLRFEEGTFFIYYRDMKFPILPETYVLLLNHSTEDLRNLVANNDPHLTELLSIVTSLKHLPPAAEKDGEKVAERYREKEIIKKRLLTLYAESPEIRKSIDDNVALFNGKKGDPRSFNLLDGLLAKQVWRLSHWRVANEEINYRRFFDVNDLAAVRTQDPTVFRETHKLIFRLIAEKRITGLRVDHPDGLYDPSQYFRKLQRECFSRLVSAKVPEDDDHEHAGVIPEMSGQYERLLSSDPHFTPFYIIGEKILTRGEKMPEDWPIFGTTGYGFLNSLNGIFIDTKNAKMFDSLYAKFVGTKNHFSDVVYEKKKLVTQVAMSGEINTLGNYLNNISESNRHTRDFTLNSLTRALTEIIAFFPVYRTYINSWTVKGRDRQYIETAVSRAKMNNPAISVLIFDFVAAVLLLKFPADFSEEDKKEWLDFVMRFQQITAPVMAKGVEDTAFYVYNRLVSLNEVGGSPDRFGLSLEAFHGQNLDRLKFWPHSLNTTSTHDSKRSEDVRARINVLSEIPDKWRGCLTRWAKLNKMKKAAVEGRAVPDRNEECLLYQTLVGAWPLGRPDEMEYDAFKRRIRDYIIKALREAKVNTSWINPNAGYEDSVTSFIDAILAISAENRFLEDFEPFQKTIAYFGMLNSLSQTLLKITCPGVPDFYQGTETWDFSLCDPDNRRPVDFDRKRRMLASLKKDMAKQGPGLIMALKELIERWEDGRVKLYVTWKALAYREVNHALFMEGSYMPLTAYGELKDQVCGFARQKDGKAVLVIVPRFMTQVSHFTVEAPFGEKVWGKTWIQLPNEISGNIFTNVLTGEKMKAIRHAEKRVLALADIFSSFPVAMLEGESVKPISARFESPSNHTLASTPR